MKKILFLISLLLFSCSEEPELLLTTPGELTTFAFKKSINPNLTSDLVLNFDGVDTFTGSLNYRTAIENLVATFETVGGNEVINNQIFKLDSTGYYKVTAGPSTRRIIDFSDVENSLAILPTGQSGNVFSEYYKDQTQKYLDGEFVKMKLNQSEIKKSKNVLVLKPKE